MAKKFNSRAWLIQKLRNISRMWPQKNEAASKARRKVQIGFYKNGNPEYKTLFECYKCHELFDRSEIDIDHIDPVVGMEGFIDWNTYIDQLFCDVSNLAAICKMCHYAKSLIEREGRKKYKK